MAWAHLACQTDGQSCPNRRANTDNPGQGQTLTVQATSAIETHKLCKTYRGFTAVRGLDLTVPVGTVFGFLGPNGAGKTTTIMMMLGNVRPTSGNGTILGRPLGDINARKRIGFLPEKFQFHEFLTATEFLHLHGKLAGMSNAEREQRVPYVLMTVGLADRAHSKLREFSKGMQQRIGLAQAILHDPELVILDEPTSALDPIGRRDVRDIVAELKSQGKTVLLNSHLLSEIEMTCDRVAIIKKGEVAIQGTIDELLGTTPTVEIEVRNMNDAALAAVRGIAAKLRMERIPLSKFTAWVHSEDDIPALARAIVSNGVDLLSLTPHRETLEDVFMRVIGE
jgi:ABC-2 type transport system ATP-binding protein